MIIRNHENWLRMLFVWKGSVLRTIIPQLALLLLVALFALFTDGAIFGEKILPDTTPFTLIGLTLAIFLAFRNNASYQCYVEARALWGEALVVSRAFASHLLCFAPAVSHEDRAELVKRIIAFAHALKSQLRPVSMLDGAPRADSTHAAASDPIATAKAYPAAAILHEMRQRIAALTTAGDVRDTSLYVWNQHIDELHAVAGGCERIASTPMPFPYAVLVHRTVYTYCLLLPFGLVNSVGIFTPLISVFLSYTLLALEAIAAEMAQPFGTTQNSLALDSIVRHIERTLLEMCGAPLPPPIPTRDGYELT
ncbi:bestrophin family protein [Paraburkholderia kururiensis]|uniref:Bestrophin family ion channel n=1 Tax=Paraburkholderia kururiensis TaxID=984307 RepID=A0ABZ0WLR1_9BURK|nr:bestrophin family ion channel [Paraburkholderia kururiensis]WQD78305.1 bestrophin family ion channel [Paraburkholderia kururiensis]